MYVPLFSQIWHQQVDYHIDVRIDDQKNEIQARQRVVYSNHSPDTLQRVFFRLAWQGQASAVATKYAVFSVQQNGIAIDFKIHESTPDPSLPPQGISQTLLEVQLSRPLLPGDVDTYTIAWQADIPVFSGGFGRNSPAGVDYTFTKWYPQACVYDALGWHLGSPFEPDFSSEFGVFNVEITLPKKYMVAATGVLQNPDAMGFGYENPGTTPKPNYGLVNVWKFQADQVRDFAWAADPEWQHEKKLMRAGLMLHAFYTKNENQLGGLEEVCHNFERLIGPYHYPQLSVVQMGELSADSPMLLFGSGGVPNLDPAISWDYQETLLKSINQLRQFRYVMGDVAFKKGIQSVWDRYRYSIPPVAETIRIFERSAGLELDWMWEQMTNTHTQVDYGIESVKASGADATTIVLQRIGGTILPLVLEIIYTDGMVERLYIPVELLRASSPAGAAYLPQPVWPITEKKYNLLLNKPLESIKSLVIDPQLLMDDVYRDNNVKWF